MEFIHNFKNYLLSQKHAPSKVTVKNYLADVRHFVSWCENKLQVKFSPAIITTQHIEEFKKDKLQDLSASSVERHISSLRKFFTFLKLEGIISNSPLDIPTQQKTATDVYRLKAFKDFLYVYNASHLTIKNYLIDVRQFLEWAKEVTKTKDNLQVSEQNLLTKINDKLLEAYRDRLYEGNIFSVSSINRKLSSLRKYLSWASSQGMLSQHLSLPQARTAGNQAHIISDVIPSVITKEQQQEEKKQIKAYSKIPPVRLAQKIAKGMDLLFEFLIVVPIAKATEGVHHMLWVAKGKPLFDTSAKIAMHAEDKAPRVSNLAKHLYAPMDVANTNLPFGKKLLHKLQYTRPNWYKTYKNYAVSSYFNIAILMIFASALGVGLYVGFIQKPHQQSPALAALPTAPPRILSFQGRLTDVSDNPISANTNLRFAIYNDATATGSALLWQEVDNVTPDSDGVFSVLLGKSTSIPSSLFTQNSSLYLGVTVSQTAELTPRQQLATVAYATNAETLQGLPPITQSGAGTQNVVLALDSGGNLSIGASTTFQSTTGQFTLAGNSLVLNTNAGSNGNITLAPDGSGIIDLQKPLQNTTNNNNIPSALGAVEVDDLMAILATSDGQSAFTVNQNGAGPIISASSGGTARFTVDNGGNVTANTYYTGLGTSYYINNTVSHLNSLSLDNTLSVTGGVASNLVPTATDTYNLGSPTSEWNNLYVRQIIAPSTGGIVGFWQLNNNVVAPANIWNDVAVGGTSTGSAAFQIFGSGTNAGTATTTGNLIFTGTNPFLAALNGQSFSINTSAGGGNGSAKFIVNNSGTIRLTSYGTGILHSDTSGNLTSSAVNLATNDVTGFLPTANGGLGADVTAGGAGELLYSTSATTYGHLTPGSLGNCLLSNGAGAPSWGSCTGGASTNNWTLDAVNGTLYPVISTLDVLAGGTSTASAKFAVLHMTGSATPVASVSAQNALGQAIYLDSAGQIQTTRNNTLTIGGNTTGNIIISPLNGTGNLTLNGSQITTGNSTINGNVILGTNSTNTVTVNGHISSSLIPSTTDAYDLGSAANEWNNLYVKNIIATGTTDGFWQLNNGALSPANSTNDVLVGGTSTASAKFQIFGNTGNATSEGTLTFNTQGDIQTTNFQDLILGGDTSGNIILTPKNGTGTITVTGLGSGIVRTSNGLLSASSVNLNSSDVTGTLPVGNGGTGLNTVTNGTLLYGSGGSSLNTLAAGSNNSVLISNGTTPTWATSLTLTGLTVNGSTTLGTSGTDTLTINAHVNSDIIPATNGIENLGDSTHYFNNVYANNIIAPTTGGTSGYWTLSNNILYPVNTSFDLAVGGISTGSATPFQVFSTTSGVNVAGTATTAGNLSFRGSATNTTPEVDILDGRNFTVKTSPGGNAGLTTVLTLNTNGDITQTGNFTTSGNLAVNGGNLTSTATVFNLLNSTVNTIHFGEAANTISLGANSSTTTINGALIADGNITLGQNSSNTITTNGQFNTSLIPSVADTDNLGSATNEWNNLYVKNIISSGGVLGFWQTNNGVLAPQNITDDVAIGGISTASAKFQIFGNTGNATSEGTLTFDTAGNIQTTKFQDLTLGGSTTGNIILTPKNSTGTITLSGYGQGIIHSNANGVLSSAPVSLTTDVSNILPLVNGGTGADLSSVAPANQGGIVYSGGNFLSVTLAGANGQCLLSNGTAAPSWGSCATNNYWTQQNGALYPLNSTVDLLIGGTATASSKFAILNVSSPNTPVASISAQNALGQAIYLDSAGQIQTTRNNQLTIGGNSTGNIILSPLSGNGSLTLNGSQLTTGNSTINGNVILGTNATNALTINGEVNSNIVPSLTNTYNLGSLTNQWNNIYANNIYQNGQLITQLWQRNLGVVAPLNITDDLAIGATATNSAKFQVFGLTGVSTQSGNEYFSGTNPVIAATNARTLTLGDANTGGVALSPNGSTGLFVNNQGLVGIGTNTPAYALDIANNGNLNVGGKNIYLGGVQRISDTVSANYTEFTPQNATLAFVGGANEFIKLYAANNTNYLALLSNNTDQRIYTSSRTNPLLLQVDANGNPTGSVAIGATNPLATLDVRGNSGTFPVASFSGQTSFATLVMNNDGIGDLFSASASSTPRFTIANDGSIKNNLIPNLGNTYNLGEITRQWNNIYGLNFYQNGQPLIASWQRNLGVLAPLNITDDVAVGGTSTSSALFQIFGTTGNATTTGTLTFTGTGSQIQSIRNQTLTIGGNTTGDIQLKAGNNTGLYVASNGNVGIGTTNPTSPLTVNVDSSSVPGLSIGTGANVSNYLSLSGGGAMFGLSSSGLGNLVINAGTSKGISFYVNGTSGTFTSGTEAMFIKSSSEVGIGTTNPLTDTGLDIEKNGAGNSAFVVNQLGSADILTASASGTTQLLLTQGGQLQARALYDLDNLNYFLDPAATATSLNVAGTASTGGDLTFSDLNGTNPGVNILNGNRLDFKTSAGGNAGLATALSILNNGRIGINTINALATLDTRGNNGTTAIASISGSTSFAGLVVDNANNGDLFTASSSGLTRFVINTNGVITAPHYTTGIAHFNANGVLSSSALNLAGGSSEIIGLLPTVNGGLGADVTAAGGGELLYSTSATTYGHLAAGSSGQCLTSGGTGAPSWGSCGSLGSSYWNVANGTLFPVNTTLDLLIGGTATASSKFAILNVSSPNTPVASISAQNALGQAIYLDSAGQIQTTRNNQLTIGGNSTGDITLKPRNGNGNVTIAGFSTGIVHSDFNGKLTSSPVDLTLTTEVKNKLGVDNGGTGLDSSSLTNGSLLYGSGGSPLNVLGIGAANTILTSDGTKPQWSSNLTIPGDLSINGNTTIGDSSTDTVTFNAELNSNIIPATNGTINLGDSSHFFNNIYANNLIGPTSAGTSGFWTLSNNILYPVNSSFDLAVGGTATGSATPFQVLSSSVGVAVAGTATTSGNFVFRGSSSNTTPEVDILDGRSLAFKTSPGGNAGLITAFTLNNNGDINQASGNFTTSGNLAVNGGNITSTNTSVNVFNTTATTIQFGGGATSGISIGNNTGTSQLFGSWALGGTNANTINFVGKVNSSIIPNSDLTYDLGGLSNRWNNIYAGNVLLPSTGGTGGYWQLSSAGVLSPTNRSNDLAIGNTATGSATPFQIFGTSYANDLGIVPAGTATTSGNLSFRGTPGSQTTFKTNLLNGSNLGFYTSVGGDLGITTSSPALYIGNNSHIGLGTNTPANVLDVNGGAVIGSFAGNTANTQANSLSVSGFIGVGTTNPFGKLDIEYSDSLANGTSAIKIGNTAAGGGNWYTRVGATGTNTIPGGISLANDNNYWFNIAGSGGVGIGANTNSLTNLGNAELVVNQTNTLGAGDIFSASTSGTPEFTIANDGTIKNSLIPNLTDTYNLGSDPNLGGKEWDTLYVRQIITPTGGGLAGFWQLSNKGVLAPANVNNDLAIGNTATGSATPFQIFGTSYANDLGIVPAGTATTSGNLSFRGTPGSQTTFKTNILNGGSLGFYTSVGGDLGINTNNPSLYIANNGNIGLGKNRPLAALDVVGSASLSGNLTFNGLNTTHDINIDDGGSLIFGTTTSGQGDNGINTRAELTNTGLFLFGDNGKNNQNLTLSTTGGPDTYSWSMRSNNTDLWLYESDTGGFWNLMKIDQANKNIYFNDSAPANAVGIGTSTGLGNAALVVNQNNLRGNGDILSASSSGTTEFRLLNTGTAQYRSFQDLDNTSYFLDPASTGTSLTVAGNVGIGTTSPTALLDVFQPTAGQQVRFRRTTGQMISFITDANGNAIFSQSDSGNAKNLVLATDSNSSGISFNTNSTGVNTNNSRMYITNTGNVGINTINPTSTLNVAGTAGLGGTTDNTSWLSGYTNREPISITNPNNNPLANYQVQVILDTKTLISNGMMRSDCGDIRFTDSTGTNNLNYFLEYGCNNNKTSLWVKIPSLLANSTITIYVYYNNSSATSTSNINNVMIHGGLAQFNYQGVGYSSGTPSLNELQDLNASTSGNQETFSCGNYNSSNYNTGNNSGPGNYKWESCVTAVPEATRSLGWISGVSGTASISVTTDDGGSINMFGQGYAGGADWGTLNATVSASNWSVHGASETTTSTFTLNAARIEFDYFDSGGGNEMQLGWTPPGGSKTYPIPSTNLYTKQFAPVEPYVQKGAQENSTSSLSQTLTIGNTSSGFGNLGINNAYSQVPLDVEGSGIYGNDTLRVGDSNGNFMGFQYDSTHNEGKIDAYSFAANAYMPIHIYGNGTTGDTLDLTGGDDTWAISQGGSLGMSNALNFIDKTADYTTSLSVNNSGGIDLNGDTRTNAYLNIYDPNGSRSTNEFGGGHGIQIVGSLASGYQSLQIGVDESNHQSYIQSTHNGTGQDTLLLNFQGGRIQGGASCGTNIGGNSTTFCNDYAEYYHSNNLIDAAEIVSSDETSTDSAHFVKKSVQPYDPSTVGIVSTNPAVIINDGQLIFGGDTTTVGPSYQPPVASAGRVPVKFMTINGGVHVGDAVTSSGYDGFGMKATKAGPIVGRVIEDFDPQNGENGEGIIACPTDAPSGAVCGKVMVLLNISWYDPQVFLTDTGNVNVTDTQSTTDFTIPHYYTLNDALGNPVSRVAELSQAAIANLTAGVISTQQLFTNSLAIATDNVTIAGQSLKDYIIAVVTNAHLAGNNQVASSNTIQTNVISPLASSSAIALDLSNSRLEIKKDASSEAVASIDNNGNATFSGSLNSQNLAVNNDATVSGTLHVHKIVADDIEGLSENVSTIAAQNITNVTNIYFATPSGIQNSENNATGSSDLGNGNTQVLASGSDFADIASFSGEFAYVPNLKATTGLFTDGLASMGPATFADTTITGQLSIGTQLTIADNSINVLGGDLQIQPLRQGGVDIADGSIRIDTNGNLNVNGNAYFNGNLAANIISPLGNDKDLTLQLGNNASGSALATSKLTVKNASGSAIFNLDQLGNIVASGAATIAKLNFSLVQPAQALSNTEVVATGSAGTAAIAPYQTEVTIDNANVTPNSLIYITPVGNDSGETPYLRRQVSGTSFTVGIPAMSTIPTYFNWLIVN